jgi:hypothetical protein
MRMTRYDIMPMLSELSTVMQHPQTRHGEVMRRFAAFLLTSREVGIMYYRGPDGMTNKDVMQWIGYGDAAWQTIKVGSIPRSGSCTSYS